MPARRAEPAEPSACAGLRRALLHGGEGFPIEPSPFQALVRRHGGSAREVLLHCQALQAEGATAGLQAHWHPALARVACRVLGFGPAWPSQPPAAVRALPGLLAWTVLLAPAAEDGDAAPAGWADLAARDAGLLQAQLDRLRASMPAWRWVVWPQPPPTASLPGAVAAASPGGCRCGTGDGPCGAPALAACCERGLPLVAHPYRAVGQALGLSEREVVLALRRWRAAGQLAGVGLAAPRAPSPVPAWAAVYGPDGSGEHDDAWRARLRRQAGVLELVEAPTGAAAAAWRPSALALLLAPAAATAADLRATLRQAGLDGGLQALWPALRLRLREAPLLFDDAGARPAGAASGPESRPDPSHPGPMDIASFDDLLQAATRQDQPQRLLFVFTRAELPADATPAQRQRFEDGEGGELVPLMCVDKTPAELPSFAALQVEARQAGPAWDVVFVAAMADRAGGADAALQRLVEAVKQGRIEGLLAFDAKGEPLRFG